MLLVSASAAAVTLDFEQWSAGTIIDSEYAVSPYGVTISADNFGNTIDAAVVFDTRSPTGGDWDLGAPFSNPELGISNPGNILILQENGPCDEFTCSVPDDEGSRPAGQIVFEFDTEIFLGSIDFFDIELQEAGGAIRLFDRNDLEILPDTFFTPDTGGDNTWARSRFEIGGIKTMVINMQGSGGFDNITYHQQLSPVPVPGAVWLFGSALGLLGWLRGRRATRSS